MWGLWREIDDLTKALVRINLLATREPSREVLDDIREIVRNVLDTQRGVVRE